MPVQNNDVYVGREPILTKYTGGGYTYLCEAPPGAVLTEARWKITRINDATGEMRYADAGSWKNLATDYATVSGLSYS